MDRTVARGLPVSDAEEAALLSRLRRGEEAAFEGLVHAEAGRLLAVARRILGSEEDAREVVQEAFLSAFRALESFDGRSRLSTWLHRITVNAALGRLRKRERRGEVSIDDLLPRFLDDGHQADPAVEWRDPSDLLVEREETRRLVRQAIERLPQIYRTVLVLRDIEEMDTEETAHLLGVTTGVVKTRLHRARQALRTLLDRHFRGGSL